MKENEIKQIMNISKRTCYKMIQKKTAGNVIQQHVTSIEQCSHHT